MVTKCNHQELLKNALVNVDIKLWWFIGTIYCK